MRVRPAVAADLAGILAIDRTSEEAPHWAEAVYAARLVDEEGAATVRTCLFVADMDGVVVGYGAARVVAGEAELESVAVGSLWRRQGIGRELCRALMEWARVEGAGVMDLEVRSRSSGARNLYRDLSFCAAGRRASYYSHPEDDALLMRANLRERDDAALRAT